MKIFSKKQTIYISICCFLIASIFIATAFLINDDYVARFSLAASLVVGVGSLMMSFLALTISIQTFVRENKKEREELENKANNFIIENNDEIGYIPLCLIASSFNRQWSYKRKIYSSFNKLNNSLQKEVLRLLNYNDELITKNAWIDGGIIRVNKFINKFQLGNNFFVEKTKYYKNAVKFGNKKYKENVEYKRIFSSMSFGLPSITFINNEPYDNGLDFFDYLKRYIHAEINSDPKVKVSSRPLDILISQENLLEADDESLCVWSMCVIDSIAEMIIEKYKYDGFEPNRFPSGNYEIVTFEDRFLHSLSILFDLSKCIGGEL